MILVPSARLEVYRMYMPNFTTIVPTLAGQECIPLDSQQLTELVRLGCALSYLAHEKGEEFNRSKAGKVLQKRLNYDRELLHRQQFLQHFSSLLFHNSISLCEDSFSSLQAS
jgi:hypothetical protein